MAEHNVQIYFNHNAPLTAGFVTTSTTNTTNGGQIIPNAVLPQFETWFTLNEMRMNFFNRKSTEPTPTLAPIRDELAAVLGDRVGERDLSEYLRDLSYQLQTLEHEEAKAKALATLIERLDDRQRRDFNNGKGAFRVKGKTMTYKLSMVAQQTCKIVDGPHKGEYLCIYSTDRKAPKADELLGMKFAIEANEADFLKAANPNANGSIYYDPDGRSIPRYPDLPRHNAGYFNDYYYNWYRELYGHQRADVAQRTVALNQRLQALTEQVRTYQFTLNQTRDFVDANAFGDLNQRYIAGAGTNTTLRARNDVGTWDFRIQNNGLMNGHANYVLNAAGPMANHAAGPLNADHCADCRRRHNDLQTITNTWNGTGPIGGEY